jgi:hypothetical protein
MNILYIEEGYKPIEDLEETYNSMTEADVDVFKANDTDFDDIDGQYDVILSDYVTMRGTGWDILDKFEADTKALMSPFRDEVSENPVLSKDLQSYYVLPKRYCVDLQKIINDEIKRQ